VGEAGVVHLAVGLVEQVRDVLKVPVARAGPGYQVGDRRQRVVAADHDVHAGVLDELVGVVGRGDAAEDRQRVRVNLLQEGGELDRALALGHPVQVEPEHRRFQPPEQPFDIQRGVLQHQRRDVDDLDV
jgi:hypothetical protein